MGMLRGIVLDKGALNGNPCGANSYFVLGVKCLEVFPSGSTLSLIFCATI